MTAALDAQPFPVQFSLCIWGDAFVWEWGARVVHIQQLLIITAT